MLFLNSGLLDPTLAWETFLPVASVSRSDKAVMADLAWLAPRGCDPEAPMVLRAFREYVVPLVRRLESTEAIRWFSIFVHDRASGVPTAEDDRGLYIHLRFCATHPEADFATALPKPWMMTRRAAATEKIAGVEHEDFESGMLKVLALMGRQSACYLDLVEALKPDLDDLKQIVQVHQFLHFFANMAQMRVS